MSIASRPGYRAPTGTAPRCVPETPPDERLLRPEGNISSALFLSSLIILTVLAVVYFVWPIWRATFPMEIDGNEGWNAYNADAVFGPRPLYPAADDLITNNYPPLSFYLVAIFSKLGFDSVYVGRAISLFAMIVISGATAICARQLGAGIIAALVGALWFLAVMARFFDEYVGMNDPHIPALAVMATALAWLLSRHHRQRPVEPAIVLMAIAGFYKHTLIATPAAALVWLISVNWQRGTRAAITGIIAAGLVFVACLAIFGTSFISQLLFARHYSLPLLRIGGELQWIAPVLVIWAIWAWFAPVTDAKRFTQIYITGSLFSFALQSCGDGVDYNSQFELVLASAIGLGLAFDGISCLLTNRTALRARVAILAVLIARLLASPRAEPYLILGSPEYRKALHIGAEVTKNEIERIRIIPGTIICTISIVCRWAGKPFVLDHFAMQQRIKTGRLTAQALDARLHAAGIRREIIDRRTSCSPLATSDACSRPPAPQRR